MYVWYLIVNIKRSVFNGQDLCLLGNGFSTGLENKYSVFLGENGSGKSESIREIINNLLRLKIYFLMPRNEGKYDYYDSLDNYLSNKYKESIIDKVVHTSLSIDLHSSKSIDLSFSKTNQDRYIKNRKGEYIKVTEDAFRYHLNVSTNVEIDDLNWLKGYVQSINIIAVSESNHIKFPLVQDDSLLRYYYPGWLQESTKETYYNYKSDKSISFKEKSTLLSILKSSLSGRTSKLGLIFDLLGLDYKIKLDSSLPDELVNDESRLSNHLESNHKFSSVGIKSKIEKSYIENVKKALGWYKRHSKVAVSGVFSQSNRKLSRSFTLDLLNDSERIEYLYLLIDNNLISVSEFNFSKDENLISFPEMSSGQICLISSFSSISANINDNSFIFIDEPELSLHPSWSSKYIGLLQSVFESYKNCHFIIATHSPHIVSNLPDKNAFVVIMKDDRSSVCIESKHFNFKSVDFQLAEIFGFPGDQNEYLVRKLMLILSKFSENEELTNDDFETVEHLKGFLPKLKDSDPVKHLIFQISKLVNNG